MSRYLLFTTPRTIGTVCAAAVVGDVLFAVSTHYLAFNDTRSTAIALIKIGTSFRW